MKVYAETERLILRELVPSDYKGIFELDSDPEVHRYLGNQPIKTLEDAKYAISFVRQQYIDNGIGRWAVTDKETGEFMGWAGLKFINDQVNDHINFHDIGYRLIRRFWNRGYATEAAKACVNYGLDQMKLPEIFATVHTENIASRKVLEKSGLHYIETFNHQGELTEWLGIRNRNA